MRGVRMTELTFSLEHLIWWAGGAAILISLLLVPTTRDDDPQLAVLEDLDELPVPSAGAARGVADEALPDLDPALGARAAASTAAAVSGASALDRAEPWSGSDAVLPELGDLTEVGAVSTPAVEQTPAGGRTEAAAVDAVEPWSDGGGLPELEELTEIEPLPVAADDAMPELEQMEEPALSMELDDMPDIAPDRPHLHAVGAARWDDDAATIALDETLDMTDGETAGAAGIDDFEGLDLDSEALPAVEEMVGDDDSSRSADDFSDVDVETKLDLATAYVEIGDVDAASRMIAAVLEEGNDEQRAMAMEISGRMGG